MLQYRQKVLATAPSTRDPQRTFGRGVRIAPDPFERADITSNTYYDWLLDYAFLLVPAQDYVGQFLTTFRDYPQRQKAASFNMDEVFAKLKEAGSK
jgi:hypothetical protein